MTRQDALHLNPALQMFRQRAIGGTQTTKEDDLLDACASRSTREVVSTNDIEVCEVALSQPRRRHHIVHEIDGVLTPLESKLGLS